MKITFYECTNCECGLRFPHHEEISPRCPKCLGKLIISDQFEVPSENENHFGSQNPLAIVMDNIRSGFNVGAIIRTAECLGAGIIGLGGITPDTDDSTVRKTSLGAENNLIIIRSNRTIELIYQLKNEGFEIWALEIAENAENIFDAELSTQKIALVVGNERCGIDPQILEVADRIVMIPMVGSKRSLNVEVSLGVALGFLLKKQSIN